MESETCNDCGCRPKWRHSAHYCRYCHGKNGHRTRFSVDLDKLDQAVGETLADKIIEQCKYDGEA